MYKGLYGYTKVYRSIQVFIGIGVTYAVYKGSQGYQEDEVSKQIPLTWASSNDSILMSNFSYAAILERHLIG